RLERGEIGGEIEGHVTQKALGGRRAVSEIKALRRRDFTPHCLRLTRDFHWMHAKLVEQRAIALSFRIAGRQELVAVENGVCARRETKRLNAFGHFLAAGGQAHHRFGHRDARGRYRAHEFERIELRSRVRRVSPMPTMPPLQTCRPALRTLPRVSSRSSCVRVDTISP